MSEASATAEEARELERAADELYGLRPEEFSAARDAAVKQARADGKPALARELGKLRKPTLSAWLVNLLWRDQRDVMEQLFELAAELGEAQAEASGPALRELAAQRRQLEHALLRRASSLAEEKGVSVTDSVAREAQETLSAALAQPEVADEVRGGRLVKPASYSGFGVAPPPRPASAAPARKSEAPTEPLDLTAAQRARKEREEREERERAQRRAAAERARAVLAAAVRELAERTKAADLARQRQADLSQRVDQLREQLQRAQTELDTADDVAASAEKARDQAQKAHDSAREDAARADREATDEWTV